MLSAIIVNMVYLQESLVGLAAACAGVTICVKYIDALFLAPFCASVPISTPHTTRL